MNTISVVVVRPGVAPGVAHAAMLLSALTLSLAVLSRLLYVGAVTTNVSHLIAAVASNRTLEVAIGITAAMVAVGGGSDHTSVACGAPTSVSCTVSCTMPVGPDTAVPHIPRLVCDFLQVELVAVRVDVEPNQIVLPR